MRIPLFSRNLPGEGRLKQKRARPTTTSCVVGYFRVLRSLRRQRGTLALASRGTGGVVEAEGYFRRGLQTALGQGSKMFALRLTTSLARLWADQGRYEQARHSVAEALAEIRGGRDTPDVREANALLSQMLTVDET